MTPKRVYFDHNATTPLSPEAREAIAGYLAAFVANPSSTHEEGRKAKKILNDARDKIAAKLGVFPDEIYFTSGCTEALHLLIRGLETGRTLISSEIEHSAVYNLIKSKARFVPVGTYGAVQKEDLAPFLHPQSLAIFSCANSETGVLLNLEEIAALCQERSCPIIIDGAQILGKMALSIPAGVTAMAFSAHKFGGPKGVGFFFLRRGARFDSALLGGHQERSVRPGTENLLGIVAMAAALERPIAPLAPLRDHFEKQITSALPFVTINGEGPRLPNTSNLAFEGVDAEELLIHLDQAGIAASHGSACSAGALEPSRILTKMGYERKRVKSSVRFSFGHTTTKEEIETGIERIITAVRNFVLA